jgi:FKBP-type peptidyl-prolyl cis-trans isomerase FkpA
MLLRFIIACMILSTVSHCTQRDTGGGDLLYVIHKNADGPTIEVGDLVELTAIEKTEEDSVLWRSADYDRTALVTRASSVFTGDLFAALGKLSKGDSATVKINLDSMVEKMGQRRPATKGKYIIYELSIHNVISDSLASAQFLQKRMAQCKQEEANKLTQYEAARQLKTTALPSGLQYSLVADGAGAPAHAGDTVAMRYSCTLMSGKVIDTALQVPRTFIAGLHTTIAGLEEAMQLFPAGAKATVIIPSALAFGEAGYENIQPYTPLIYELEVVRIGRFKGKHPNEPGAPLPDFAVTNIANDVLVQKEDVHKSTIMLVLFSTDCDHCQHLIEAINKQPAAFNKMHVYFISQDSKNAIQQCMQHYGPALLATNHVTICRDENRRMAGVLHTATYPSVYVYNQRQVLVKYLQGEAAIPGIMQVIRN